MNNITIFLMAVLTIFSACDENVINPPEETEILYTMPEESEPHEGTWLQWPHEYQYGVEYRDELDPTWVAMTEALVNSENVHIIAYNQTEKNRITALLTGAGVSLNNVDFKIYKTDDVWIRDNGPIYVHDKNNNLVIQDWGFNGWGEKDDPMSGYPLEYTYCDDIPRKIGNDQNRTVVNLNNTLINEGGSIVMDGNGTLMACKSSILNDNRNPNVTQAEVESIFKQYLGATNFVWLEGQEGLDITDQHIDGFAVFGNASTIVTMNEDDLLAYKIKQSDIDLLYAATNKDGIPYNFVKVPLTQEKVIKTDGTVLNYKGSYINYYVANTVVLVPNYNDANDQVANDIIQALYPNRTVVGIDVRDLYQNDGMVHCVTQQQPM